MIAVYHGHSHIVEVLTRLKSDVNLQTKVGVVVYVVYVVHVFACSYLVHVINHDIKFIGVHTEGQCKPLSFDVM